MSKFLDLIEENTPDLNLDEKIAAKRALQRCLMEKDIKCDVDQRSEDVMIHLPVNATDNMERIGMAVSAAEKIVGANNPRRGMQFQNPKKKIERSIGKVYSKVADQLNSVLKTI